MKALIVKTSSMGDVLHALPAVSDVAAHDPRWRFDWVVEESFSEIPAWHKQVDNVIPVALRRWRKNIFAKQTRKEWRAFKQQLQQQQYDLIIDAQGLLKSAWLSRAANGTRHGFDAKSARESLASWFYQQTHAVAKDQHAVIRLRKLFAKAFHYSVPQTAADYGIDVTFIPQQNIAHGEYVVFLHGTTWDTKLWPELYWKTLKEKVLTQGLKIYITSGNDEEYARALRIAGDSNNVTVLPRQNISTLAGVLAQAKAIVAVDTGLGHLAAALAKPTISLYGPTDAELTGAHGPNQYHLSADFKCAPCLSKTCTFEKSDQKIYPPCFNTVNVERVWQQLSIWLHE